MTTTHDRELTAGETCKRLGRPVPEWFNIDVLVDTDELVEIEAIRTEMRSFMREAIVLGERVRWALSIANRFEYEVDDAQTVFTDALATEELIVQAGWLQKLFEGGIHDDNEYMASLGKHHAAELPELIEALHKIQGEVVHAAAERGSFEVPRKPVAGVAR
jgi:hypothetical protein